MTRRCAWCEGILGEICPHCGSRSIVAGDQSFRDMVPSATPFNQAPSQLDCDPCDCHVRRLLCLNCTAQFNQGDGGETHGICERCRMQQDAVNAATPPALTAAGGAQ